LPKPLKYEQIDVAGSAIGLNPPDPNFDTAYSALIQAEGQNIRWRDDGTDPTAAVGMILTPNTVLEYDGDLNKIKFIEAVAGGILNVSYYGV
jgi:hypothetical protein